MTARNKGTTRKKPEREYRVGSFCKAPFPPSDEPPSSLPNSSVAFSVAHQTKSGVSISCGTKDAVVGISEKSSRVAWETGRESKSISRGNAGMAAAVLSNGGVLIDRKNKNVDINLFPVSLAHTHSNVLKATARQNDIQLVGELAPCSGCSIAKGFCAPTPRHTTSRAANPMDIVHIDTAGPFQESLRGSRYVVMFPDSASRFQRPYGPRTTVYLYCRCGETLRG